MDGLAGLSFGFIVCLLFLSIFAFETDEFPFFLLNLAFCCDVCPFLLFFSSLLLVVVV